MAKNWWEDDPVADDKSNWWESDPLVNEPAPAPAAAPSITMPSGASAKRQSWEGDADQLMADTAAKGAPAPASNDGIITRGVKALFGDKPEYKSVMEGVKATPEQAQAERDRRLAYGAGPIAQNVVTAAAGVKDGSAKSSSPTVNRVAKTMAERGEQTLTEKAKEVVSNPANEWLATRQKAAEFRDIGEFARDIGLNLANGAVTLAELPASIIAPGSKFAKDARAAQKYLTEQESAVLEANRQVLSERIQQEDGFLDQYLATVSELVTNPTITIAEVAKQVPMFIGIVGTGKLFGAATGGAMTVAERASPTLALGEAISGGVIRAGAVGAGQVTGGIAASMALAGGDAASSTYQRLTDPRQTPKSVWEASADYQRLRGEGVSHKDAVEQIAVDKSRFAAAMAAPLGLLGYAGAEASFINSIARRGATSPSKIVTRELAGETLEETGTQLAGNVAVNTVDPSQSLTEGLGEAAGMATVTSAPFAGAAAYNEARRAGSMQEDVGAGIVARQMLDPNTYDPRIVDPLQTVRQSSDVGPSAPSTINFTPADSPTREAGLPDIVVPIPTGAPNVGTTAGAGPAPSTGGQPSGDLGGTSLGVPGLAGVGAGGLDGGSTGGVDSLAGPAPTVAGTSGQPAADLTPRTNLTQRATDADLLARVQQGLPQEPSRPVTTWSGRAGDGYATVEAAQAGLESRIKREPELDWRIEPQGSKFILAGYSKETPNADQTTQAQQGQAQGQEAPVGGPASLSQPVADQSVQPAQPGQPAQDQLPAQSPVIAPAVIGGTREEADALLGQLNDASLRSGRAIALRVAEPPQDVRFAVAARFAEEIGRPLVFIEASGKGVDFNALEYNGALLINTKAKDFILGLATHEGFHALPADIRKAAVDAIMQTVTPEQRAKFLKVFDAYTNDSTDRQNEEIAARIIEQDAQNEGFWQAIADRMGDSSFAKFARSVMQALDRLMAGFPKDDSNEFTTNIKRVREVVADAYAQAMERQGIAVPAGAQAAGQAAATQGTVAATEAIVDGVKYSAMRRDLVDAPTVDFQDLVGKRVFGIKADLLDAGRSYTGIDGSQLEFPVEMMGGPGFPRLPESMAGGVIWAVRGGAVLSKIQKKLDTTDYVLVHAMNDNSHLTNTTASTAYIKTVESYLRDGRIGRDNLIALDDLVRDPKNKLALPDFPGFEAPNIIEYIDALSFDQRGALAKILEKKEAQKHGLPNLERFRRETIDPEFVGYRQGDAMLVLEIDKTDPVIRLGEKGTKMHPSYPLAIKGRIVGKLSKGVNYEVIYRDYFANTVPTFKNEEDGAWYGFDRVIPEQTITQEIADSVSPGGYKAIKNARQAEAALAMANGNWLVSGKTKTDGGVSVQEFVDALRANDGAAALTMYTPQEVKAGIKAKTLTVYQLGSQGGDKGLKVFFGLKRGAPWYKDMVDGVGDNEVEVVSVTNNEKGATGIGIPGIITKAIQEGATVLDAFAVKSKRFPDGFLPEMYGQFGFDEIGRVPFDPSYYNDTQMADLKKFWADGGWKESDGYPDVVVMRWSGNDEDRAGFVDRYVRTGETSVSPGATRHLRAAAGDAGGQRDRSGAAQERTRGADRRAAGGDQGAGDAASVVKRAYGSIQEIASLSDGDIRNLGLDPAEVSRLRAKLQADDGSAASPTSVVNYSVTRDRSPADRIRWRKLTDVKSDVSLDRIPAHITPFATFMRDMAVKANNGGLTSRDLIKAYTIARSSMNRGAINTARAINAGLQLPTNFTDEKIRPEGAFGFWLLSPVGQRYLNAAELGLVDAGAVADAVKTMAPFGTQNALGGDLERAAGGLLHSRLPAMTKAIVKAAEGKNAVKEWQEATADIYGVREAKKGFLGSLLGFGQLPTFDARQINLNVASDSKDDTLKALSSSKARDVVAKLARRMDALQLAVDPEFSPFYRHLAHHAVWDAVGGTQTTHSDVIDAMVNASVARNRAGRLDGIEAYHYSKESRKTLVSSAFGTGLKGSARDEYVNAEDPRRRERISFYVNKGTGIQPEAGVGGRAHRVTLDNIYDANSDPQNLRKGGQAAFESAVLDAGFDGYLDRLEGTQPGQVILLGKRSVEVTPIGPRTRIDDAKVVPAAQKKAEGARTVGNELVRRIPGDQMPGVVKARPALREQAPTFRMEFGEARVAIDEQPAADRVLEEAGAEFRFGVPAFSKREADPQEDIDLDETPTRRDELLSRLAYQGYQKAEVPRVQAARNLAGLLTKLDNGALTPAEFELQVRFLADRMGVVSDIKATNRLMAGDRQRGADIVREKLIAARRRDEIDFETTEFALWALDQNPAIAEGLGITVREAPEGQRGAAGDYNPASAIMRVFKGKANTGTAVHEILHHTERMMPEDVQAGIRKEWAKAYGKALTKADPKRRAALEQILKAMAGDKKAQIAVGAAFSEGVLDRNTDYQLVNPSEFWAVNATDILQRRFEAGSWVGKAKQWLGEMLQKVKGLLGLRSDAPVLRGLQAVLESDGSRQSKKMLSQGDVFQDVADPDIRRSARQADVAPTGLYSALARSVTNLNAKALPVVGWKDAIKGMVNKGQIKQDEVEWSGINDWLSLQQGRVTKDQVLEYLNGNGVQVEETVLADGLSPREQAEIEELHTRRRADSDSLTDAEYARLDELESRAEGTKYGQYTLPGGENYREVLLTLPASVLAGKGENAVALANAKAALYDFSTARNMESADEYNERLNSPEASRLRAEVSRLEKEVGGSDASLYVSQHWDQRNILAHIRVNDRTDADGSRVLFVEEIQSDWGQEGKKKGFQYKRDLAEVKEVPGDEFPWKAYDQRGALLYEGKDEKTVRARGEQTAQRPTDAPPLAPFVTKTEGWLNLALKRVITMAAEGGYDKVAFVNGQQSADRYDLSKQISKIRYEDAVSGGVGSANMDAPEGTGILYAYNKDGNLVIDKRVQASELEDHVGKELASRLLASKPVAARSAGLGVRRRELAGIDLKIGGEGMKTFYDTIIPTALKKLLPKVGGGQMGEVGLNIAGLDQPTTFSAVREGAKGIVQGRMQNGTIVYLQKDDTWGARSTAKSYSFLDDAYDAADALSKKVGSTKQPGFTITDAMREKAGEGLPMFSQARNRSAAEKFDPAEIEKLRTPAYKGRERLNEIRIDDFLALADAVAGNNNELDREKVAKTTRIMRDGGKFNSLPFLQFDRDGQVTGHEGRHRAMALKELGYETMPVVLWSSNIRWDQQDDADRFDYVENWPTVLKAQSRAAEPDFTIPFPVSREGASAPYSDDINLSQARNRQPINGQNFELPGEGKWMATRRALQDQFIRMREVQDALIEQGGTVGEAQNVYLAEELSYGRIQEQMKDFAEKWVKPMTQRAAKAGVELDELALYAYAKHAPERNKDIAGKNQTLQDGGSGMTNKEAADILAKFQQEGKTQKLEDLRQDLLAITDTTRIVLLQEGLITQDQYDAMQAQFQDYVPLRGFERQTEDGQKAQGRGAGKGFNVRGPETMKALGRTSRAGDIVENIVADYERAIVRAERNNVAKAFLDLVTTNPDPDLWEIDAVRTSRSLNRKTGQVEFNSLIDKGEDTVAVKVGGKEVFIKIHDPLLARALRQAWKDETGAAARILNNSIGVYTNWMRNVLTRYNVAFSAVNAARDLQAGGVAAYDKLGAKGAKLYFKYYAQAAASSFRNEVGSLDQGAREMDKWFEEFRAAGGTTGGFFMRDAEEIRKDIRTVLLATGAAPTGKVEAIKGSKAFAGAKAMLRALEILGSASENAARVAAYRAAREIGKSPAEAASIAKNLTTNFNRKGEWGQVLNSLYLFFNAAVQGSHRVLQSLKNPRVRALMAGVSATAMGLAFMGASIGGDDEDGESYWDQIPDFEKERSIIIMLPPGTEMDGAQKVGTKGRYIKIPAPYGFNIFPAIGYALADLARYSMDPNRGASPVKAGIRAVSAVFGAYNPMGGSFDVTNPIEVGMAAAPTFIDLPIQLAAGVNSFGQSVGQFKSPYDPRPDSEIAGPREAGTVSQSLARWMNQATGGNAGRSGLVDVQPATINNLARTFGGGAGDFLWATLVNLPSKALTPEAEIMLKDVPVAKAFAGTINKDSDVRKFYQRRSEVLEEYNAAVREMKLGIVVEYDEKSMGLQALGRAADQVTKQLSAMRKEEVRIADDETMTKGEKIVARREIEKMRVDLARQFNSIYSMQMREANQK